MVDSNLLSWLLVGHFAGDYLLQTRWMAEEKTRRLFPLFVHGAVYTAAVLLVSLPAGGLSSVSVIIIFIGHIILDNRTFVKWWVRTVNGKESPRWMALAVDQSWHLIVLALAVVFS